jgi:hypothetical protein
MDETTYAKLFESGNGGKEKTLTVTERQLAVIQVAVEAFRDTVDGKNNVPVPTNWALGKLVRECADEIIAALHSQGG